ncbi:MAG: ABC transporter permease [Fimbriimonadaceae bacterium]
MFWTIAWRSVLESPARTALCALGVMVGTVAMMLLVSIGLGVQQDVRGQVEDLGANVVVVVPGRVDPMAGFNPNLAGQSWFQDSDQATLASVRGVRSVAKLSFVGGGIEAEGLSTYPFLIAASPEWFRMHRVEIEQGRPFGQEDDGKRSLILGSVAAEMLFEGSDAIGKKVTVNGEQYTVTGISAQTKAGGGIFASQSLQNVAYIPYSTFRASSPEAQIDRLMVWTEPDAEPKELVSGLEGALGQRLDRQQFSVLTQEDLLGLVFRVFAILSSLVVGLTSIALFVGGLGILAIMTLSVSERKREIGIRKAVGARSSDLFAQFLVESALIGLGGVAAGVLLSVVVCSGIAATTAIKPLVTWGTVLGSLALGVGVGCVFGVLPAIRASRLDPVVALRAE